MGELVKNPFAFEPTRPVGAASGNRVAPLPERPAWSDDVGRTSSPDLGRAAKDAATHMVEQARDLAESKVEKRTERGARELDEVARALKRTSQQLGDNFVGPYVEKAADQLGRASRFLRTADVHEMTQTTERFARKEPLFFLGGALALGFLGARFLKSSSHHRAPWSTKL